MVTPCGTVADGVCFRRTGATVIASTKVKADPKTGTTALSLGDELVVENLAALSGGKGGAALGWHVANGMPATVTEAVVTPLDETNVNPEQMWVSWCGGTMADGVNLYEAGVRTDDTVSLELASPCMPKPLMLLRMPPAPKKAKGGKGKGKGKKKK